MKPKNFPGNKERRRIDAEKRANGTSAIPYTQEQMNRIGAARSIRTKKDRV